MSVDQTKDGRFFVRYKKGRNPDDPTRTIEYFGRGPDAEKAARKRDAELKDRRRGCRGVGAGVSFAKLSESYLQAKVGSMSASDMNNLIIKLKNVILPHLGDKSAMSLDHRALDTFVAHRAKTVKKTTIHRDLSYIRAILNWSVERKFIVANPMDGYKLPTRDDSIILPPTEREFSKILKHAAPHLVRAMLISYHTGLRPGVEELFRLTWSAVDLDEKTIEVVSADKGGMPLRLVPLNDDLAPRMKKWHLEDKGKGYLVHYKGRMVKSIKTAWRAAKRRAEITRPIRPYAIRHMAISNMLGRGADLRTVAEIVGHSSPEMTLKVYAHSTIQQKRAAVEKLQSGVTYTSYTTEKNNQ